MISKSLVKSVVLIKVNIFINNFWLVVENVFKVML